MKPVILSLAVVGMTALTVTAQARESDKLCATLRQAERALADAPLTVTIVKLEPFETVCQRAADQAKLCHDLMAVLPLEHIHIYPWRVRGCLEEWGRKVRIQTTDGLTGLTQSKLAAMDLRRGLSAEGELGRNALLHQPVIPGLVPGTPLSAAGAEVWRASAPLHVTCELNQGSRARGPG
jgi:hypothetical protein